MGSARTSRSKIESKRHTSKGATSAAPLVSRRVRAPSVAAQLQHVYERVPALRLADAHAPYGRARPALWRGAEGNQGLPAPTARGRRACGLRYIGQEEWLRLPLELSAAAASTAPGPASALRTKPTSPHEHVPALKM
mmetsp:Transcript_33467/g.106702  ORF Transcript_33467/g.106702 Transcript_33467/m.106702 type:complete len:137 (+) Transcript_33467:2247-2657(+)|eukprot:scaffold6711_cov118-Isochrysis_galbana.AAC.36